MYYYIVLFFVFFFWFFNESAEKNNRNNRMGTTNYYIISEKYTLRVKKVSNFVLTHLTRVYKSIYKSVVVLRHR